MLAGARVGGAWPTHPAGFLSSVLPPSPWQAWVLPAGQASCSKVSIERALKTGTLLLVPAAGPTVATAGLSMQVPIAVLLDLLFRSPAWLSRVGSAVLTLLGGGLILAGFFGINLSSSAEQQEQVWRGVAQGGAWQRDVG